MSQPITTAQWSLSVRKRGSGSWEENQTVSTLWSVGAPARVAVAGDWHYNTTWARHVIEQIDALLVENELRLILHLGDFGFWPASPGKLFIATISKKLEQHNMHLWFVDGNHEWHTQLAQLHDGNPGPVPVDNRERIWHLPRGTRWEWHEQRWLAVGGAGTPDWRERIPYVSWWPEEVISPEDTARISADGRADVLMAHDCPWSLMPEMGEHPAWWDMSLCIESSQRLQLITFAAQPKQVFHGHLHRYRDEVIVAPWGAVRVTGLSFDGGSKNWGILDTRSLEITQLND
jgi:hypothetical protein